MKKVVFKSKPGVRSYPEDIDRFVSVLATAGYEVERSDAELAWGSYSEDYAAGWLILPEDDEVLVHMLMGYLTVLEEGD